MSNQKFNVSHMFVIYRRKRRGARTSAASDASTADTEPGSLPATPSRVAAAAEESVGPAVADSMEPPCPGERKTRLKLRCRMSHL